MLSKLQNFSNRYGLWILGVIHFFGVLVISWSNTDFWASFTPLNLLIATVFVFMVATKMRSLAIFFFISFLIGYFAELLGTQTGFPFGNYQYLQNLGPKIIEVPLLIGVNWFLMAYASRIWANRWLENHLAQALLASLLMVFVDFFIEPISAILGFWQWENDIIPTENYFGWLGVSFLVQLLFPPSLQGESNAIAKWYLPMIFLFFLILNFTL
jgi:uncharacterized membrane protein